MLDKGRATLAGVNGAWLGTSPLQQLGVTVGTAPCGRGPGPGHRGPRHARHVGVDGTPGTLETGLVVNVPLFINEGEIIKVDTSTGQYLGRA